VIGRYEIPALEAVAASEAARTPCAFQARVTAYIGRLRLDLSNEKRTQRELHDELLKIWQPQVVQREARLGPGDIPDFLIEGRLVIELKGARHRGPQVWRQLGRYAAYPKVEGIILATARAMTLPATVGGKPLTIVNLGRAWL
jgi:hypothetical protein